MKLTLVIKNQIKNHDCEILQRIEKYLASAEAGVRGTGRGRDKS